MMFLARRASFSASVVSSIFFAAAAWAERPMSTDRPDATESPFTVEPGRYQIEASAVSFTRERHRPDHEPVRETEWNLAPVNLRMGVSPSAEVQLILDNYRNVEQVDLRTGARERVTGWGDVTLRFKQNLWGNDGGDSGLAWMPWVKLPTAADGLGNDHVEGGLIVPYARELGGGWSLGLMTELDLLYDETRDTHEAVWLNTATVSRELGGAWGGFLELAWEVGMGRPAGTFNTGVTYTINDDSQLDAGVFLGLTRAAPDIQAFVGWAHRY